MPSTLQKIAISPAFPATASPGARRQLIPVSTLIFLDTALDDWQQLSQGAMPGTAVQPLHPEQDAIAQITATLQAHSGIRAVHILSHGAPGCLYLGNGSLSLDNLAQYGDALSRWFAPAPEALPPTLSLYACHVAAGDVGAAFTHRLHQLTGAQIFASAQLVGSPSQGGSWQLDAQGKAQGAQNLLAAATIPVKNSTLERYHSTFAPPTDLGLESDAPDVRPLWWAGTTSGQQHLNDSAFAAIQDDGSVITWGDPANGGDSSSVAANLTNVVEVFSAQGAFAALRTDGSVITWGNGSNGGDSSAVAASLSSGVKTIFSTQNAFAALKDDGSVVTWGNSNFGGDSSALAGQLSSGVSQLFVAGAAFAALKDDGSVVTWGNGSNGGDSSSVATALASGVSEILGARNAFVAIKDDGSAVTWGNATDGGNSTGVDLSSNVSQVLSTERAFAALKRDGSVAVWGDAGFGGNAAAVDLASGVQQIFATQRAFAALKADGTIVTWGNNNFGGNSTGVTLTGGFRDVYSNQRAFAAIKNDGTVITWGNPATGGDSTGVDFSTGVREIFATEQAFAALKNDGSVVTWGDAGDGGDSSGLDLSGVVEVFATEQAFAALKADGTVVTWGDATRGGDSSGVTLSGISSLSTPFSYIQRVERIDENSAANSAIGRFFSTDPDSGETFTYSLVPGPGDTDNGAFTISGDQLLINSSPDFETQASYSIRVQTQDSNSETFEKQLTIGVNDLPEGSNSAPTDLALDVAALNENLAAGSEVATLSTTDADATDSHSYSLVPGAGDTDNGAFSIAGDKLVITASPDFETQASYSIRVQTDDGNGGTFQKELTINVTDLNDVPTDLAIDVSAIDENQPQNTEVGSLSTTDADTADTHSYSLVAGAGDTDNSAFTITGDKLILNEPADFEAQASYSIRIQTDDGNGGTFQKELTISVNDVNEGTNNLPTDLTLDVTAFDENLAAGSEVATLSTTDADATDSHSYSLVPGTGDTNNGAFSITGDKLVITASPDFETQASYSIRVQTDDGNGGTFEKVLTIGVTDLNDVPTDLAIDVSAIDENQSPNTEVGTLSTTDADTADTHSYSFVAGAGDTDNAAFTITGDKLILTGSADFETQDSYSIRIQTDDGNGGTFEKALTIGVNDLNEPTTPASIAWNTLDSRVSVFSISSTFIASSSPIDRTIEDTNWRLETTGDLNGDGQDDVLLRNALAGQHLVWFMAPGGNSIQSEALFGRLVPDPNWSINGTGDFDGDGKVDVLLRNQAADQNVVWYMDGQGGIREESLIGRGFGDNNWSIVATADFNNDGNTDILLRNALAGQTVLWEMNGKDILRESLVGRSFADPEWLIEGARDFDGDGVTDIFMRQQGVGIGLVWKMADLQTIAQEIVVSGAIAPGTTQIVF